MADATPRLPDYLLEQYLLGELPAEEKERLDRLVEQDPALRSRLAALRASNEEILAAHPPEEFARAVELQADSKRLAAARRQADRGSRASRESRAFRGDWGDREIRPPARPRFLDPRRRLVFVPAIAAVVLLAAFLGRPDRLLRTSAGPGTSSDPGASSDPSATAEVTREKGAPHLRIYRRSGTSIDSLHENAPAGKGDILQLSYVPFGRRHGVILSIDGRGAVTLHFPAAEAASTRLDGPGEILLPEAYELDDAPGFERFFLITASGPIDVARVLAEARKLAATPAAAQTNSLPLPDSLEQSSFLLRKRGTNQ